MVEIMQTTVNVIIMTSVWVGLLVGVKVLINEIRESNKW